MNDKLTNVVFVCVENSCRSQMAEGFARKHGHGWIHAFSAGSRPSGEVNGRAIAFMAERGVDLRWHGSKGFVDLPDLRWDYVVTIGCGDHAPYIPTRRRVAWDLPDPKYFDDDGFRLVRDRIETLVRELIDEAARTPHHD